MITVIAGVNGAGKSSIFGQYIRKHKGHYFNPDEVARSLMRKNDSLSQDEANSKAWLLNVEFLQESIETEADYAFETTLGGNTITQILHEAMDAGREVRILYCGLNSTDLHIKRVAIRVSRGGHDIPEHRIRERWINSIHNMLGLVPKASKIQVYDNSLPVTNGKPEAIKLIAQKEKKLAGEIYQDMPQWAKPLASAILAAAAKA
ncbi:MAG: ZTL protein [Gammaproteobacteria bacterium]|nr:ZTL protein [Gammaproteobacteria bacterium]